MSKTDGHTVICTYRVRAGEEEAFEKLLAAHWPTLDRAGLVVGEPSRCYRGQEEGGPVYTEIFTWKDGEESSCIAHEHPEVQKIWGPMGELVEPRPEGPPMAFPHVRPLCFS